VPRRCIALLVGLLGPTLACAGATANPNAACELAPADSQYLLTGPVYQDCAVDQPARHRGREIYPETFEPRIPLSELTDQCYRAAIEFVVDTTGAPELATARVVRTNHPEFADAVLATLPRWRYRPARKDGVAVRQIVREERALAIRLVVRGQGVPPTPPPRC